MVSPEFTLSSYTPWVTSDASTPLSAPRFVGQFGVLTHQVWRTRVADAVMLPIGLQVASSSRQDGASEDVTSPACDCRTPLIETRPVAACTFQADSLELPNGVTHSCHSDGATIDSIRRLLKGRGVRCVAHRKARLAVFLRALSGLLGQCMVVEQVI